MKALVHRLEVAACLASTLVGCSAPAATAPTAPPPASVVPSAAPAVSAVASPSTAPSVAPSPSARPLTTVKTSETGPSPSNWPLYVGVAKGFFTEEGINIDNTVVGSSVTQTDALISGDLNINIYSVDSVAKPVSNGAPIKYIATDEAVPAAQMIVASDVNSFADLRGKTLAAGSALGYFDVTLKAMMSANGLQPDDYSIVSMGNSNARFTALQTGQIQGMIASAPDDAHAIAAGYKSLGYVNQYVIDVEYNGYALSDAWGQANRPTVVAFLRAVQRSVDFIFDPATKAEALAIYNQDAGLNPDELDLIYNQMVTQEMLSRDLRPKPTPITNLLTLSVQNGAIPSIPPLATWVDTSYLDQAEQSLGR